MQQLQQVFAKKLIEKKNKLMIEDLKLKLPQKYHSEPAE